MDLQQIENRIAWLDEQRRKSAESATRVSEQLQAVQDLLATHGRQLQSLSSEVSRLASFAARITQFDEALQKHRQEILRQLETFEDLRSEKERYQEVLRKADQEEVAKAIDGLRVKASALETISQTLDVRREEEIRITRSLDAMEKRTMELAANDEERARQIAAVHETRKVDGRRTAEMQEELTELRTRANTLRGHLDTLEDRIRRTEAKLGDLAASDNERRENQVLWTEQQNLRQVELERAWKEWERRFETFAKKAEEFEGRVVAYEDTHRSLRKLREELDTVLERLERRITEIMEVHRLTEDRTKHEWASFQADDQKRWNTYRLGLDEQWKEHLRLHDKISDRLQGHEEGLSQLAQALHALDEVSRERVRGLAALVHGWTEDVERGLSEVR
jgi:chromosome segregation ATPase